MCSAPPHFVIDSRTLAGCVVSLPLPQFLSARPNPAISGLDRSSSEPRLLLDRGPRASVWLGHYVSTSLATAISPLGCCRGLARSSHSNNLPRSPAPPPHSRRKLCGREPVWV